MTLFAEINIERYREITHAMKPPIVLKRKTCVCGKQVTTKELTRYGHCNTCARSAARVGQA